MLDITFITPVAPYHTSQSYWCQVSVAMQYYGGAHHIVIHDTDERGPAWMRNEALQHVETKFVVFLDATSTIAPNFCEAMLGEWRANHYVYCGWSDGSKIIDAPLCPWAGDDGWHPVTTLLETAWVRRVGGFDESLPIFEDREFYLRLLASGCCGFRLPESLMSIRTGGKLSERYAQHPHLSRLWRALLHRYGRLPEDDAAVWSPERMRYEQA